jgi:hypothetical protein
VTATGTATAPGLQAWQRGATAAALGGGYLLASRHIAGRGNPDECAPARAGTTRAGTTRAGTTRAGTARAAAAALCAGCGPALLVVNRLGTAGARWRPPPSTAGRLLLGGYVAAGALLEEVLWRAPLILIRARTGTRPSARHASGAAALSAAGFLALHLRRDGARSLPAHLTTTASWTLAALVGRQLRWPLIAHAGYNFAAASLRAAGTQAP